MKPTDALEFPHSIPNTVYLCDFNGEPMVHVVVTRAKVLRVVYKLKPSEFETLDRYIPLWPWSCSAVNPRATIHCYTPDGTRCQFQVNHLLDYNRQTAEYEAGTLEHPPGSAGWIVDTKNGDLTDLSPENSVRRRPQEGERGSKAALKTFMDHRAKLATEGRDPNTLLDGSIKVPQKSFAALGRSRIRSRKKRGAA